MRRILPLLALALLAVTPRIAAADPPKAMVSADKPDSEYVRDKGVTFAVSLGAHKGQLRAIVTHLSVGGLQLSPSMLSASIQPAGAAKTATLVLRDASVSGVPPTPDQKPKALRALGATRPPPAAAVRPAHEPCPSDLPTPTDFLRDQGDYTATVEICDSAGPGRVSLELRFKKKPATLRTDAAIKLRHIRKLLGLFALPDSTTPSVAIFETSGASDIHLQAPPYRVTLPTTDGTFTASLTPPKAPGEVTIPAGGSLVLASGVGDDDHVGVAQGVMAFRAPELAGGIALVPIEVTTRESLILLGLVIFGGLFVGVVARGVLEPVRARNSALADAWTALTRLPPSDPAIYDAGEVRQLNAMRAKLEGVLHNMRSKPEEITDATQAFDTALDAFLTSRARDLATASKALDDWSGPIDEARDQPPVVADVLATLKPQVAAGRDALQRQALSAAQDALSAIQTGLAEALQEAMASWRRTLSAALEHLPVWPEVPQAAQAAQEVETALVEPGDGGAARDFVFYTKQLQAVRAAHQALRDELYKIRLKVLVEYTVRLRTGFGALPNAGLFTEPLLAVDAARDRLSGSPALGIDDGLDVYVAAEAALFEALRALFAAATPDPDPGVSTGNFEAALNTLAAAKPERPLNNTLPAPPPLGLVRMLALATAVDSGAPPRMQILAPSTVTEGSEIELRLVGLQGTSIAADIAVSWRIGASAIVGRPSLSWTIRDPGALPIQATLEAADGSTITAFYTVTVLPLRDRQAADVAGKRALAAAAAQLAISAGVIWIAGFTLLAPSFVGTWEQFAGAFLWGFASDLGLTKAVELAKGAAPSPKAA